MYQKALLLLLLLLLLTLAPPAAMAEETPDAITPPLRITEVMASNGYALKDSFGGSPDWIEIFNTTDAPISLKGICVSDKADELGRYMFPEDAVIGAGEYLIIFASGLIKNVGDEFHTPFKLSAAGEGVYLSRDGELIDSLYFVNQQKDISLSLDNDGEYKLSLSPTPGYANIITEAP